MTREELFRALGEIDESFIEETVNDSLDSYTLVYEEDSSMAIWKKICLAAACFALVAAAAVVIFIRSRAHDGIIPPLSGNPVSDSAELSMPDSVSDNSSETSGTDSLPPFPETDRVLDKPHPEWLEGFNYETDFYTKPDPNAEVFHGSEKDETPLCTINNKERLPNLFCYGNEKAYLSLYGKVYEYDPETDAAAPLFEGNAYDLNYKDGALYYVIDEKYDLDSRDVKSPAGCLFRYDLATGVTKQLTDYDVAHLVVAEHGIYFVYTDYFYVNGTDRQGYIHMCRFDEETGVCERLYGNFSYIEYNGYNLIFCYENAENRYYAFEKDGVQYVLPDNADPNWDSICGDYYYFVAKVGHSLNRLNMLTGEIDITLYDDVSDDGTKRLVCQDYTVFDGDIYYINSETVLCRYNEETGESVPYYSVAVNGGDRTLAPRYLYTDGDSIYALLGSTVGSGGYDGKCRFARLTKKGNNLTVKSIALE